LKYRPYAFTELGVATLSSVLRSERAIQVNIAIMRTFVRFRTLIASRKDIAHRVEVLERRSSAHDKQFREAFTTIEHLMFPEPPDRLPVGFAQSRDD
jgi:hypothetical protein